MFRMQNEQQPPVGIYTGVRPVATGEPESGARTDGHLSVGATEDRADRETNEASVTGVRDQRLRF